nr:MAG TPA: hypothetical protein [Caudoviricetes sp.]
MSNSNCSCYTVLVGGVRSPWPLGRGLFVWRLYGDRQNNGPCGTDRG